MGTAKLTPLLVYPKPTAKFHLGRRTYIGKDVEKRDHVHRILGPVDWTLMVKAYGEKLGTVRLAIRPWLLPLFQDRIVELANRADSLPPGLIHSTHTPYNREGKYAADGPRSRIQNPLQRIGIPVAGVSKLVARLRAGHRFHQLAEVTDCAGVPRDELRNALEEQLIGELTRKIRQRLLVAKVSGSKPTALAMARLGNLPAAKEKRIQDTKRP